MTFESLDGPFLSGRAQAAYAALEADQANDYDTLKAEILRRYDNNEETYRLRFRKPQEFYRELVIRLQDLQKKWMRECTNIELMNQVVVKEQLITTRSETLDQGENA